MTMTANDLQNPASHDAVPSHEPLSVLAASVDDDTWRFLKHFSETTPLIRLRLRLQDYRVLDSESVFEGMGNPLPDICLIDFDRDRRSAVIMAERIHSSAPEVALFAISSHSRPDSILEAMRSGCSEYLTKSIDRDQFVAAVARVGARRKEKRELYKAQVLAFIGAKGGVGVTTIVTQMAAHLADSFSRKTLVVDLHPDFGDAALYLGLTKSGYDFFELLENTDRLDADFLQSFLMHHSSGLDLISAPEGTESPRAIVAGAVTHTFNFLQQRYEYLLVDLPPGLNDANLELIRYCDQLYLVTVAEVSAVRNVLRQIDYFTKRDIPKDRIRIVLNRYQKRSVVSDAQIEKALGQRISWRVPNHYPQVVKTIHEGNPVAQLASSEVARNLKEWAGTIGKKPGGEEKKKEGGGILGLWNR
jgi:pilus assembly protein CpaE